MGHQPRRVGTHITGAHAWGWRAMHSWPAGEAPLDCRSRATGARPQTKATTHVQPAHLQTSSQKVHSISVRFPGAFPSREHCGFPLPFQASSDGRHKPTQKPVFINGQRPRNASPVFVLGLCVCDGISLVPRVLILSLSLSLSTHHSAPTVAPSAAG